ncbi:RING finger and transmembrane domain-containing protein 2 isoform X2 [Punica granatum]|uniref:RING finger and transmembrane domain-containing protein 2 isoform X2 n=1 Tax=Punica granatum TaxID=22663 RepID=A0A218W3C0_PUNGR|nr:RING finger and transmembrane domain-containing protein 2 isoform X2 [Punica granatum]OWM67029.1 hypothetical protein CDL15_Pgr000481 [Punica granatum]
MEASGGNSDSYRGSATGIGSSGTSNFRRYGILSASNIIQAPISTLLEYSGLLRTRPNHPEVEPLFSGSATSGVVHSRVEDTSLSGGDGEVSIRIIGAGEQEHHRDGAGLVVGGHQQVREPSSQDEVSVRPVAGGDGQGDIRSGVDEGAPTASAAGANDSEVGEGNGRDSTYQRYDIQQAARWIEQVLPFSLLLLVVFIRQHLQGFFITIWIAAVLFKSNDILRKQTALKGERRIPVLAGISLAFALHVAGVYWWYRRDDLLYPLIMLPPKAIPPFWHAIFIIMVNDTMVRQAAMVLKCFLLMYYRNSRGRNYRRQGQMLTLVEYLLLLYRALLPTPVWYRFFLNKEYGSLFSSLMTGLYLTFKLTSVVEKVQCFFTALRALSRKEVHYGAYATAEQVNAAGDLCAICQEKMHAPILLRCKHIFCEDCVSEWFERERTCPLCRALVKSADLRSFGDGSTSLFFQLF